ATVRPGPVALPVQDQCTLQHPPRQTAVYVQAGAHAVIGWEQGRRRRGHDQLGVARRDLEAVGIPAEQHPAPIVHDVHVPGRPVERRLVEQGGEPALERAAQRHRRRASPGPLGRAVRTKSLDSTSSIAARVIRARTAMDRVPSVSAGSTRKVSPPYPDGGSHRSVTANRRMSSNPTQYTGNDTPRYASSMLKRSTAPPGRTAARAPSVIPQVAARSIAERASWSVLGKRSSRSPSTGRCVMYERPRSPRIAPQA